MTRPIRWLHISDLHFRDSPEHHWWTIRQDFCASVEKWVERLGPPDLLLITGDLSFQGAGEEFGTFDTFLDDLLGCLGNAPILLPIPGNHDVQRPKKHHLYSFLEGAGDQAKPTLDKPLWDDQDPSDIAPLFEEYTAWFNRRILPGLEDSTKLHRSHFPGDYCARIEIEDSFPLCVVGLNSTWQQYKEGDFERRLHLPEQQFQAALPKVKGNPLAVFDDHARALLLMHHPPGWLSSKGLKVFEESIYRADRFDLVFHGHLHENRSQFISRGGGPGHLQFQARSLCGIEEYGEGLDRQAFGYAWGDISEKGEVRVWPLRWVQREDGRGAFSHDDRFDEIEFPGLPTGSRLRGPRETTEPTPPPDPQPDFQRYLAALESDTSSIDIRGIFTEASKGVVRQPIERLYTPLRSHGDLLEGFEGLELEEGAALPAALARGRNLHGLGRGSEELSRLLPRYPRLLIEGQPGAGKTTFLHLVACMLARDQLGHALPHGAEGKSSWSHHVLGLEDAPPVPILIKLSDLPELLARKKPGQRDDRNRLLDFLAESSKLNDFGVSRLQWKKLLESGGALLLLDALDEVADSGMRGRLFKIFEDATRHWPGPMVVASRPIQTARMRELGFHTATVEPFRDREIRTFLDHWVAALHSAEDAGALDRAGADYRQALESAIIDHPGVRRLASNPVMLTCLCVVHFNEGGRLPDGRNRVYHAVLRWLIVARSEKRKATECPDHFVWNALARLALAMLTAPGGKRSVFDLQEAADAVESSIARQFPDDSATERAQRARRWLRFECAGSGILEELPQSRLRFWHLTFQEYLAALQLAWYRDGEDGEENWWPLLKGHLDDSQWRETVELLPGCLLDKGGESRVDLLLTRVLKSRGTDDGLEGDARVVGVLGRMLEPLKVLGYTAPKEILEPFEKARESVMPIFELAGAVQVPVEVRIKAAEALGSGGDPRLRDVDANFLAVPGTTIRLGRYPVTVEEFEKFRANRGYETAELWLPEGWSRREQEGWEEPDEWTEQRLHPNRPVTGVSWFEAVAYCRWLSQQRNCEIRLPTEEEWQAAAKPDDREYPWGDEEPDAERANFSSNVKAPTPVGIYPSGAGKFGHLDLGGNVWEWCSDLVDASEEIRKMYGVDDKEPFRAQRGGGWRTPALSLQSAFRSRNPAWFRDDYLGFRVSSVSSST